MRVLPVFLLCMMLCSPCMAGTLPALKAPAAYRATLQQEGVTYEALLRLREGQYFVLHERATLPGGAVEERSRTGRWRQVADGTILQLASQDRPVRKLNVGGAGALYVDVQPPGVRPVTVAFKQTKDSALPYTVFGWLGWEKGTPLLHDEASDRLFALLPDPRLDELAQKGTDLFVVAEVEESGKALRLLRLHKTTERAPGKSRRAPEVFESIVQDGLWRLSAEGLPPLSATFTPAGESGGQLELVGQGLRLHTTYAMKDEGIRFHTEEAAAPALPEQHALALRRLLESARDWNLEGDVLVLSRNDETLCVLEKTGTLPAPGGRGPQSAGQRPAAAGATPLSGRGQPIWTEWSRK